MKISKAYPYPVLRNQEVFENQDILSKGNMTGNVTEDSLFTYFRFTASTDDVAILRYIEQGLAEYTCEIDIPDTFFRMCQGQKDNHFVIKIPKSSVAGKVTMQLCVVAKINEENRFDIPTIRGYANNKLHSDYSGLKIDYYPGDIMAILGDIEFYADVEYRKAKSINSFMCIMADEKSTDVDFLLDAEKITILMPKKMFEQYQENLKGDKKFASILEASLVSNALSHAFHFIADYEYKLWARSLNALLGTDENILKIGINPIDSPESIPIIVQTLLKKPMERMFNSMDNIQTLLA